MEIACVMLAVTIESVLFVLVIIGAIAGVIASRIYLVRRQSSNWRKGHGPGHESFLELPYNRDQVFQVAHEVLAQDFTVNRVARVERLMLGEGKSTKGRGERVTVRVDPTLQGCELLFIWLGSGWKSIPAGANSPVAEHFFNGVSARLGHVGPGSQGVASGLPTAAASPVSTPQYPAAPPVAPPPHMRQPHGGPPPQPQAPDTHGAQ